MTTHISTYCDGGCRFSRDCKNTKRDYSPATSYFCPEKKAREELADIAKKLDGIKPMGFLCGICANYTKCLNIFGAKEIEDSGSCPQYEKK